MQKPFASLIARAGHYTGVGTNHDELRFLGDFTLAPILEGRGVAIQFSATGMDGEVYHQEWTTLALGADEKPKMWTINTNITGQMELDLRRTAPEGDAQETYVFAIGDSSDVASFREEIALDLWADGDLSYRYSWGLPGGEFGMRSGLRLNKKSPFKRPSCIVHWSEILAADDSHYPGSQELLSYGSTLAKHFGLKRLGIHHEVLPPGRRTSWPHAESHEEEFVYVIKGHPQAWIDGHLHPLMPGDAVGFKAGTGIAHTFINNSNEEAHLLVVGETSKPENKVIYPLHPKRNEEIKDVLWKDAPKHPLGPHDGKPMPRR